VDAIPVVDAQHRPILTVGGTAIPALLASTADHIDLADNALANPGHAERSRSVGHFNNFADELVAGHASEGIVTAHQFQVGAADTGQPDADKHLSEFMGTGYFTQGKGLIFEPEGLHGKKPINTMETKELNCEC
jgi:hypothetical protein